jgi:hypothetical protein
MCGPFQGIIYWPQLSGRLERQDRRCLMRKAAIVLVSVAISMSFASPVLAQGRGHGGGPPDSAGGPGHGHGQGQNQGRGEGQGPPAAVQTTPNGPVVIADRDRNAVYSYYRTQYASGNCPPGLAKKNNGCLPPGQANKVWAMGQPLPVGVGDYPLPGPLLGQLTPYSPGYEYVRVANDILLMAVGTRMIVGALADLGSL